MGRGILWILTKEQDTPILDTAQQDEYDVLQLPAEGTIPP